MAYEMSVRSTARAAAFAVGNGRQIFIWSAEFAYQGWRRYRVSTIRPQELAFVPIAGTEGCSVYASSILLADLDADTPLIIKLLPFPVRRLIALNDDADSDA